MQKRTSKKSDNAVSPVVGVMLMLVVTIIIAAVVSTFASGLVTGTEKAPSITMDVSIKNTGYYTGSAFTATVLSTSDGVPTSDLKIVTSWTTTNKTIINPAKGTTDGSPYNGGASVTGNDGQVDGWTVGFMGSNSTAPWGYGSGVESVNTGVPNKWAQQFGNYTLLPGTVMSAMPAGQGGGFGGGSASAGYGLTEKYYYSSGWTYSEGSVVDGMQAVLGDNWNYLRTGDTVNVKIIHIPSESIIYEKDVVVS